MPTLVQAGTGTTILTGANSYTGATSVAAGTLLVNGNQGAAIGLTSVASGAIIGGTGTIGGDLTVANGATLAPGAGGAGTLTMNGDLTLGSGSRLAYEFGQANVAGGLLNDLVVVGGDLVLDGTIDVSVPAGGSFDPGIYRVFSYAGALTDNGLAVGAIPSPGYYVQTSIGGQVNLVSTTGLTLNYWDGAAGPKNNGVVNGGNGVWQAAAGNDNWTTDAGSPNAPFTDASFAVFAGAPGTVTVDPSLGAINVAGMQFATSGYVIQSGPVNLVGAGSSTVRVGDGTAAGAGMTATINSVLAGSSGLAKTDAGTLVLTGTNTYAGGTAINGGVLQVASDANLGAAAGGLSFSTGTLRTTASFNTARATTLNAGGGTIETAAGTTLGVTGAVAGAGALTKTGTGTLVLSGTNSYAGGTAIRAGTVEVARDANLGAVAGPLTLDSGTLRTTADITTARGITLGAAGGTFETLADTALTAQSAIAGPGGLTKAGGGALILRAANSYAGPTSVTAGTLAVGDATSTGASINGPVSVAAGATLGGYGRGNGNVTNAGTIAVADALDHFATGGAGQFAITGTLTNANLVDLAGAAPGNRLQVGSYVGQGGILNLNTVLAGDDAPTDQLVINGGSATGSSILHITNFGGGGADTPGNGIAVVVAAAGATTAPGAFAVNERLVAGPYEYNLFRGGRDGSAAESWFLRSQALDSGTPAPAPEPDEPLYREEVPTYTAVPAMALMFGRSTIGTLHDRLGEREQDLGKSGMAVWGRALGGRVKWDAEDGGVYNEGPAFSMNTRAFQAGVDVVNSASGQGGTVVGLYGLYGEDRGRVRDFDMTEAGRARFDAYAGGLYATHYDPSGWYADAVAQVTRYKARAGSGNFDDVEIEGTGYAGSLELGKAFALGNGLSLEPQAQVIYQSIDFADTADEAAEVQFSDAQSLAGRLGLRLTRDSQWNLGSGPLPLQGWLRANVWREFMADPKTAFSSDEGFVPFRSDLKGTWAEIGGGVSGEVATGARIYASGGVQTDFGKQLTGWDLKVGFHLNW